MHTVQVLFPSSTVTPRALVCAALPYAHVAALVFALALGVGVAPVASAGQLGAQRPATSPPAPWRIDDALRLQLVHLGHTGRSAAELTHVYRHIPASVPDITNIAYPSVLSLGFPLPKRSDAEALKLYLKLYEWPSWLDAAVSAQRVLEKFLLPHVPQGRALEEYVRSAGTVRLKLAFIDAAAREFEERGGPLQTSVAATQEDFDAHVPFSSLYLLPPSGADGAQRGNDGADRARASAAGVLAFHRELLATYHRLLLPLPVVEGEKWRRFVARQRCIDEPTKVCSLSLFEVAQEPMVFTDYRSLPMPEDPTSVFLSGLLLVRRTELAASVPVTHESVASMSVTVLERSFHPMSATLLEVASVLREPRGAAAPGAKVPPGSRRR